MHRALVDVSPRLLDFKTNEAYYQRIVARYMKFCSDHSTDLDAAFASLSIHAPKDNSSSTSAPVPKSSPTPTPTPSTTTQRYIPPALRNATRPPTSLNAPSAPAPTSPDPSHAPTSVAELQTLLLSLRKLREALLSSHRIDAFAQRAHIFSIRLAILAMHPVSYEHSLSYLLNTIHPVTPLPLSELAEFTTYAILDAACRSEEYEEAYFFRRNAAEEFGYSDRHVDAILKALVHQNAILFWKTRRKVDGYQKRLLDFAEERVSRTALKVIGRSYMGTPVKWVESCAGGGEKNWDQLVEEHNIGWAKAGDWVTVRKVSKKVVGGEKAVGKEGIASANS
jgi:hypothetical protein